MWHFLATFWLALRPGAVLLPLHCTFFFFRKEKEPTLRKRKRFCKDVFAFLLEKEKTYTRKENLFSDL